MPWKCRLPLPVVLVMLQILPSLGSAATSKDNSLDYILERYAEANGGRAALEQIISVRLRGYVELPDGSRQNLTVLKKKPNLVRMHLDTGMVRIVQAYNGRYAWFSREAGRNIYHDRMRGPLAADFVRDAPLESVLMDTSGSQARLSLGQESRVGGNPCREVVADYQDGTRIIHFLDQKDFRDRRIVHMGADGSVVAEFLPSQFEKFGGVVFSLKTIRMVGGKVQSTLIIEEVEINLGVLDDAFDPPVDLPET